MQKIKNFRDRTFSSLKIRNYRLYFIGQTISLIGSWMQTIAQDWLVLSLTHSGIQLGVVSALQFLPILIFGPWGGLLADRIDKRKILYITQAILGILALVLGLLVAFNSIQLWMVYILAVALGFTNALNNPSRQAFVFEMVGKNDIQNAVTLNSIQFNLARAIGPAVAGTLIATLGLSLCFILNGVSFIAVIVALYLMRAEELSPPPPIVRAKGQIKEGFKYVLSTPELAGLLLIMTIIGTFSYEFSVSLPIFANFTFNGNASTYALLTAAFGIGSATGGFIAAGKSGSKANIAFLSAAFGLSMVLLAVSPTLIFAIFVLLLVGALSISLTSLANSTIQIKSKPEMRGRTLSLWNIAILGSTPIGGPIIGYIGEHFSPRWAIAVGGFAAILAAALGEIFFKRNKKIPN